MHVQLRRIFQWRSLLIIALKSFDLKFKNKSSLFHCKKINFSRTQNLLKKEKNRSCRSALCTFWEHLRIKWSLLLPLFYFVKKKQICLQICLEYLWKVGQRNCLTSWKDFSIWVSTLAGWLTFVEAKNVHFYVYNYNDAQAKCLQRDTDFRECPSNCGVSFRH